MGENLSALLSKAGSKCFSGKFLLTISAAVVFVYATVARILPEEAVASIVSTVFAMYFLKKENGKETNGQG